MWHFHHSLITVQSHYKPLMVHKPLVVEPCSKKYICQLRYGFYTNSELYATNEDSVTVVFLYTGQHKKQSLIPRL